MRERFAPYTRYAALLGLVFVVFALGAWLVASEAKLWMQIVGAVGILLVAVTVLLHPAETKAILTGRQARYGGNALLMSVAFLLIVGMVNYLGTRHHQRWDTTESKQFSLSEQTLQILRDLQEPVQVKLFFTPSHYNRTKAEDLVKEYAMRSNKFTYEFIDPDRQRREAMDYQINRDGTIVFEQGNRRELCFGVQEQDLTSALLKVTSDTPKKVYFLTGHQERDIQNTSDAGGYSLIAQTLRKENYQVSTFNLSVTDTIPSDMSVLVVAAPRHALSPEETERLRNYVANGGSLLILLKPGIADPLNGLLADYGIVLHDDLIIDPSRSFFGDIVTPLVDHYTFHQITKDLTGLTSVFPTARSIEKAETQPKEWNTQCLATTSNSSWAETDYHEKQVKLDKDERKGPLGLAVVVEPSTPGTGKGRLVVVGDADFVSDQLLKTVRGGVSNVDLFMNTVGWLAEEESLISIRPKPPEQHQVVLTPPQARAIIYSNILFLPLVILALGAVVWWNRR